MQNKKKGSPYFCFVSAPDYGRTEQVRAVLKLFMQDNVFEFTLY